MREGGWGWRAAAACHTLVRKGEASRVVEPKVPPATPWSEGKVCIKQEMVQFRTLQYRCVLSEVHLEFSARERQFTEHCSG